MIEKILLYVKKMFNWFFNLWERILRVFGRMFTEKGIKFVLFSTITAVAFIFIPNVIRSCCGYRYVDDQSEATRISERDVIEFQRTLEQTKREVEEIAEKNNKRKEYLRWYSDNISND